AQLLRAGKIATVALGGVVIAAAVVISRIHGVGLFLLMQRVSIMINVPILVPLILGLMVKRTPPWSGWSTVAVGFGALAAAQAALRPAWAGQVFGLPAVLDLASREYWRQGMQVLTVLAAGSAW